MGKSDAVWAAVVFVIGILLSFFLLQWLGEEDTEKKLRSHYRKLLDEVLEDWKRIQPTVKVPESPLHSLTAKARLFRDDQWNRWMLSHVTSGYPELWQVMGKLKSLEEEHNKSVPIFMEMAEKEADDLVKSFTNLLFPRNRDDSGAHMLDGLARAVIRMDKELIVIDGIVQKPAGVKQWLTVPVISELIINDTILATGDEKTISKLKRQIDDIRTRHRAEYDKFLSDAVQEEELLECSGVKYLTLYSRLGTTSG